MAATPSIKKVNRSKTNLLLDIALALAFVCVLEMRFTGLTLHELIGVGIGIGLLVHLILHWRWVLSVTRTFFSKLLHESRFNYLLDLISFADLFVIVVTGIAISRTLGLNLGLDRSLSSTLERWHILASGFSLLLVGLHVALHWKWIVTHARQYLFRLPFRRAAASTAPTAIANRSQHSIGGES